MADHLETPFAHRLLTSPAGALFDTGPYEAAKLRALPREFAVLRARAAADVSLGSGPEAFLREADAPPAPEMHDEIARSLARYASLRADYDDAVARWEEVFWGDGDATDDERVAVERERRAAAARRGRPTRLFRRLVRDHLVPPVKYDLPDPEDALARWRRERESPGDLYSLADDLPAVERSASVRGPGTSEYRIRFETPSPHVGEAATARVYEPPAATESLPTLVFHSGVGSMGDALSYWPEEESVARTLAPLGYRVILPDAPWHGRREVAGAYSGEPYVAGAPVSVFVLLAAAATETGVLVDWARRQGAPAVGVGGISLGGITTLHVAGRCGHWPESTRPDLAFPVAASGDVTGLLFESDLRPLLDLDDALAAARWTPPRVGAFAPALNPPDEPALAPERVYAVSGLRDGVVPVRGFRTLLDRWGVPQSNRLAWDVGHLGVLVKLARESTFQNAVRSRLGDVRSPVSVSGP